MHFTMSSQLQKVGKQVFVSIEYSRPYVTNTGHDFRKGLQFCKARYSYQQKNTLFAMETIMLQN